MWAKRLDTLEVQVAGSLFYIELQWRFRSLVGMDVRTLLPTLGAELLQEASHFLAEATAARVFSFQHVTAQWGPGQMDTIDGTAEILCAQGGSKLLLRCSGTSSSCPPAAPSSREHGRMLAVLPSTANTPEVLC